MSVIDKLRETFRPRVRLTPEQYLAKLTRYGLNADGTPKLDPVPLAPPIGYKKAPSMVEIVRDMVRSEKLRAEAEAAGHETFEESEDFDVPDEEPVMRSPWENQFDPPLEELLAAGKAALAEKRSQTSPEAPTSPKTKSGGAGGTPPRKPPVEAAEAPEEP